jgi:hypothetical protein
MNNESDLSGHECITNCSSPADQLNRDCFCKTLNREQLDNILRADDINQDVLITHPQLFSNTSVFISSAQFQQIRTQGGGFTPVFVA